MAKGRYQREKRHTSRPLQALCIALLTLVVCLNFLTGSTWAWFTDVKTASLGSITLTDIPADAAITNIYVTQAAFAAGISQADPHAPVDVPMHTDNNGGWYFAAQPGVRYTVTVSAAGDDLTALQIATPDGLYATGRSSLTFDVILAGEGVVSIRALSTSAPDTAIQLADGQTIGTGTELPPEDPTEEPVDEPTDEPTDDPVNDPVDEPTDEPADVPVDDPVDDPVNEPVDAPTDDPVDEPTDEPVDVPADAPVEAPAET